ncbi:MAG TPA: hypothetical protein VGM25_15220 [Caulobacteraceae bacterium]|jgi:hypothetical protein
MKTSLILAAGLAAGLALTSAAHAQYNRPQNDDPHERTTVYPAGAHEGRGDWTLKRREDWLNDKINQAHDEHALDGPEADRAHHALDRVRDDENHMRGRHDGQLTDNETADLESRIDGVADQVLRQHNDAWRRPW